MSEASHSYWSASKFESIMLCPGKIVLEEGAPDGTNINAAEGTAAHLVLTWALEDSRPAKDYVGKTITLDARGKPCEPVAADYTFVVDEDMAGFVQTTIDYVYDLMGSDGLLLVDIKVNYSSYLGVDEHTAWGTADVVVVRGDEVIVVDFKYGRGVEVSAERNPQMSLYALGALQACHGVLADFTRVRMAISQPRLSSAPSEWDCSVEELETWGRSTARSAVNTCKTAEATTDISARQAWQETFLRPGEKQCVFCRAKATCPALRAEVSDAMFDVYTPASPEEFAVANVVPVWEAVENVDDAAEWLRVSLDKVDLIEGWCKAIRAEVERRLLAGDVVPGYKLVQGKRGNRQWSDATVVEETLKSMRLKESEMYDFKLISPTTADKLAKAGAIGPRQWPKLQGLIAQPEGKPHVAPLSDSRPALVVTPVADDFADVTTENLF